MAPKRDSIVVCTYGPSGIGKTTDQGYSFPRALFVAAPGALNSVRSVCGYMPATVQIATIMDATKLIKNYSKDYNTIVIDDFSFLSEQTFSTLEKKHKGFALWGELRDQALEFRDTARFSGVDVILNCFARSTEFITDTGVKSFADFEDGDEVTVLTHKGRWRKAKVRSYGERAMNTITLRRGPARHVVKATPDHRWLLQDGSETTSLCEGMCLMDAPQGYTALMPGRLTSLVGSYFVDSIEPSTPEQAWCLVVEDDSSFVLPWGTPTGNCWEQGPKVAANGGKLRGGPMLSGRLPEAIPAMCDLVLRATHEPQRKPWGAAYRCSPDPSYIMKDRFNVASLIDPAPMNLAEILRAANIPVERHPDAPDQEEIVEGFTQKMLTLDNPVGQANEFYKLLLDSGVAVPAARWILRDAMDRTNIRKALANVHSSFINVNPGMSL
jgi:hypothetical protein